MNTDDAMNADDALYPIAVLIDELKHDDVTLRLNAIHRLATIAQALGPERTREELVPFLDESIDDEDEVLTCLAEELGNLVPYIGGPPFATVLLGPLENLAAVEETLVREKAIASLCKICSILSQADYEGNFVPLIKRLSVGDWFTSRTSATGLYAAGYQKAPAAIQNELRTMYTQLCHDETPMVRRSATTNLAALSKEIPKEKVLSDVVPLLKLLAQDDQDSVRLLTVDVLIAAAQVLTEEESKIHLTDVLRSLYSDKSWRVRYMMAENFVKLCEAIGVDFTREEMIPAFANMLKDTEAEVRTAASSQVPGFSKLVDRTVILEKIMPCIQALVVDSSQHVRAALAMQISGLAPILGKELTIEHLLPLFLQHLKDEFPDVRLNIISKLEQVNNVIGIELLSQSLLPAIVELAEDKQWRVRLAIIEYIPLLASQLGVAFFDEKLGTLCMSWLGDCVFSIRDAATTNLRKLTEVFGVEWAKTTILPKVLAMATHPNYLFRMTTIFAITAMAPAVDGDVLRNFILPTVAALAQDPIPNIRFNVARSFETLLPLVQKFPESAPLAGQTIHPALRNLKDDSDKDVRYFAHKAMIAGGLLKE